MTVWLAANNGATVWLAASATGAMLGALAAASALVWDIKTRHRERRERQDAAVTVFAEAVLGRRHDELRKAWLEMKANGVPTPPAVDAYVRHHNREDDAAWLRTATLAWARSRVAYLPGAPTDQTPAEAAQMFAETQGVDQWLIMMNDEPLTILPAFEAERLRDEAAARTELLWRLGELREANPPDNRILEVIARSGEFRWWGPDQTHRSDEKASPDQDFVRCEFVVLDHEGNELRSWQSYRLYNADFENPEQVAAIQEQEFRDRMRSGRLEVLGPISPTT
jgi:hypothetical protein